MQAQEPPAAVTVLPTVLPEHRSFVIPFQQLLFRYARRLLYVHRSTGSTHVYMHSTVTAILLPASLGLPNLLSVSSPDPPLLGARSEERHNCTSSNYRVA